MCQQCSGVPVRPARLTPKVRLGLGIVAASAASAYLGWTAFGTHPAVMFYVTALALALSAAYFAEARSAIALSKQRSASRSLPIDW